MTESPTNAARPERRWQPSSSFWIIAALVLFLVLIFAAANGIGGVLLVLGAVALITGLYALLLKRRSWVGLPHRKSSGLLAGAGALAFIVGAGVAATTAAPSALVVNKSAPVAAEEEATATAIPTPTPTETNPAGDTCYTAAQNREYRGWTYVCTEGTDKRLVWMTEAASLRVQKEVADKKAAKEAAAEKLAAETAAANNLAAEKAAAKKAADEKTAEAERLAEELAAEQAAIEEAARQAVQPPAPAPYVPPADGGT